MNDIRIPEVHRLIVRLIATAGGQVQGTNQICEAIPATPDGVLRSLRHAKKYQLIRRSKSATCGRGHKSTWKLTKKGRDYVQS
jgi:DNA-binding HxlR family transcriptional regulator